MPRSSMAFPSGARLGPYEILAPIGAGGMGEVYTARDTRLGRTVAIKVLPAGVASDPDRRRRFEQEARAVSALNHPHICVLHDIGTQDPSMGSGQAVSYLVMEFLEGQTLADRLRKGALPLTQALELGVQIADALATAHRTGVVHRDLKPANVMLTRTGAKLLDFGLAKLRPQATAGVGLSAFSTQAPATSAGMLMGTIPYMAPEQLEGREIDHRTDLFAFGCLLYEMVAGCRAFPGDSEASVISAIMTSEPAPLSSLQPTAPPTLDRLVRQCLAKMPDDRPDTAHDVANDLRWMRESSAVGAVTGTRPRRSVARGTALWASSLIVAAAIGAGMMWFLGRPAPAPASVVRSLLVIRPADRLQSSPADLSFGEQRPSQTALALSPDGRLLVFSAAQGGTQQLYLHPTDRFEVTPIEHSVGGASPFFSPDGKSVGFWANGALRRIALAGGPATAICETEPVFGASWGDDDAIVFARRQGGLFRVPAAGGTPEQLTTPDGGSGEFSHRLPHVLPGARGVLFTAIRHYLPDWDEAEIVVQPLPRGARRTITRGADARYAPTGHLIFVRSGTVVAAPFDLKRMSLTGGEAAVVSDVMQAANTPNATVETGAAQLAVSSSGVLVYAIGGTFPEAERVLVWKERTGDEQPLLPKAGPYIGPHLSRDGQQVVLWTQGRDRVVWVYDTRRQTMTRVTTEGRNSRPIWTPDSRRVTFASSMAGPEFLASKAADGTGTIERLPATGMPSSWSPSGVLAFVAFRAADDPRYAIWLLPSGDGQPRLFRNSRFSESYPEFSPDGLWIAYVSDMSGRNEVYVQPYPGPGPTVQVSNNGGIQPAWASTGRELFYTEYEADASKPETRMMSVSLKKSPAFPDVPRLLWRGRFSRQAVTRGYDVTPDGQRFLMVQPNDRPPAPVTQLVLVQNWHEELKRLVPTR